MKAFLLGLSVTAAVLYAAAASAASLRPSVVVEGETVRLGDIFEDTGPKANTPVLYSPAPGRNVTLNANWLAEVARLFQVQWRPLSQYDRVVVQRAGRLITATDIKTPLRQKLLAQGMPEHSEIELVNHNFELNLPLEVPSTVDIRNVSFDATTGQFNALVLAGGDAAGAQRALVQGRIYPATAIPVLRRPMGAGEIIRNDDIEVVYRRDSLLGRDIVMDAKQLVGRTPMFRVRAGEPIHTNDTRAPILVSRNNQVVIKLVWGGMTLSAQGKALDEGARGDVIRVENLQSHKTIEATIAGPDLVTVSLGTNLAATN